MSEKLVIENVSVSESAVVEKSKKFRLRGTKFSLTYPRCGMSRDSAVNWFKNSLKMKPSVIIVGREEHKEESKDGDIHHLHCYIQFEKQFCSYTPTVFDLKEGDKVYHPNIQNTNSKVDWIRYITKEDDNYVAEGINVDAYIKSSTQKQSYFFLSKVVEKEAITREMIQENPKEIKNLPNIVKGLSLYKSLPTEADLVKLKPLEKVDIWGVEYKVMPRVHKQKQLWICGPKNTGKTTFLINLKEAGYKGYEMPLNNDWSGYDDTYDYLYVDEFKGGITIQELNKLLEGVDMRLNTKGGVAFKKKNLPVFIISNYRPEAIYTKVEDDKLDTLLCRLDVVEYESQESKPNVRSINITTENLVIVATGSESLEEKKEVLENEVNAENVVVAENVATERVATESVVEFCNSCGGWSLNGKCACNACEICFSVKCEGCKKVWNEEAKKWIMPRPRKRVIRY